jgi:hypothetical protein
MYRQCAFVLSKYAVFFVKPMTAVITAKDFNATKDKNGKENDVLQDVTCCVQ